MRIARPKNSSAKQMSLDNHGSMGACAYASASPGKTFGPPLEKRAFYMVIEFSRESGARVISARRKTPYTTTRLSLKARDKHRESNSHSYKFLFSVYFKLRRICSPRVAAAAASVFGFARN